MKYFILILICISSCLVQAQSINEKVFELLDMDYPGLEKVKEKYLQNNKDAAAQALLEYYKDRKGIVNPDIDLNRITVTEREQKWADDALEHTFYVHDGYQPSFNYGKDIDWRYWPVKDNELRWQLHRHKWFTPMGKVYCMSGDEKYAKEWSYQYLDWIRKNPLMQMEEYEYAGKDEVNEDVENVRFAWRPLETSCRLQDQINQFTLFIHSSSFTPGFLTEFLVNYHQHALHIIGNYSEQGNHLLFEAQRILAAGIFFPEFKDAAAWRKSGIDILNREIKVQVYPDGGQYELDLHYHVACIDIFCKALRMADVNGFRKEFPESYIDTIESMILFYMNCCFPDYTNPCFSDAKRGNPRKEQEHYRKWHELFPTNRQILYLATNGKEGDAPANLSKGHLKSGFFTFRNGWGKDATVMVIKAGPKGEWHCQPDNGTFELWFNGKNLFPDSGSYVYAGNEEVLKLRNWFRQSCVHNTLTLDEKNLQTTQSVTRLWKPEGNEQVLVTENPHYDGLRHRRSVFFVDHTYFVIVDEAIGNAQGTVNLNYNLCDGTVNIDKGTNSLTTSFEGKSNMKLQCFGSKKIFLKEKEGWYSTAYRKRTARTAISFETDKDNAEAVRYITVIYPFEDPGHFPALEAKFLDEAFDEQGVKIEVTINGKKHQLKYNL